jgi:hypothetical protein
MVRLSLLLGGQGFLCEIYNNDNTAFVHMLRNKTVHWKSPSFRPVFIKQYPL